MSLTYGFYNSINKDRLYDAVQFSQIFDGVINDGIYMSVLNHLAVRPSESGMSVLVGGGRAWFNHTWTYNDSDTLMPIEEAEIAAKRIDAIVLKIDTRDSARVNSIEVIKGVPSENPVKPTFDDGGGIFYHPLAYVSIDAGITEITASMIENCIGVDPRTPFVTGIIETINAEELIEQWQGEWDEWNAEHRQAYLDWVAQQEADMELWTEEQQNDYESWTEEQQGNYESWIADQKTIYDAWYADRQAAFETWFTHLRNELDEHQAAHLQNEIDLLTEDMETFKEQTTEAMETFKEQTTEDLEEFKEETSEELTEQAFKLAHDLCNRVTNIEYENGSISQITSTNSDYSAVSVTTFEETEVGKNITTAVTKDGWIYTETVVINNNTHTITESYTKEEITP